MYFKKSVIVDWKESPGMEFDWMVYQVQLCCFDLEKIMDFILEG